MSRPATKLRLGRCLGLACALTILAVPASAQSIDEIRGAFEVSVGGLWNSGQSLGTSEATLTRNQQSDARFPLFQTDTVLRAVPGAEVRLVTYFSRVIGLETGIAYTRPRVVTTITGDVEHSGAAMAEERLAEYAMDVSLIVHLTRLGGRRVLPFVTGGASYVRQLHEDDVLVQTGRLYHAGGGLKYFITVRPQGRLKGAGLRFDARAVTRDGGFHLDNRRRFSGVATSGLFVLF